MDYKYHQDAPMCDESQGLFGKTLREVRERLALLREDLGKYRALKQLKA